MSNPHEAENVLAYLDSVKRLNASREWSLNYQNSQRAVDREINPRFYNTMVTASGDEIMVEGYRPSETEFGR